MSSSLKSNKAIRKFDRVTLHLSSAEKQSVSGLLKHPYREHGKHALADVESVSPVVIQNHSVVFPDSQEPPAQCLREEKKEISTRVSSYDDDASGFSLGESVSGLDILYIKKTYVWLTS